jgi:beta-glucosidase
MHCQHHLITEVLKRELGFDGFVVSDWEAVDKLPGSYADQLASAIDAGIDMVMAPANNDDFVSTLSGLVPNRVPQERIDDAARRILSVKCEFGLLPAAAGGGKPRFTVDEKALASIGSAEHRKVAREAVARSLVLLKNAQHTLPIPKTATTIHVAGGAAEDMGRQCGGWTISWQGNSGAPTPGTTILEAITQRAQGAAHVTHSKDGSGAAGASLAIVVGGEFPYAEYQGDRSDLSLAPEDMALLRTVKGKGVPTVLVLLTGRPLILGPALDLADAIVVAWLPGTEGQGVSDVLFGDVPPTGKLGHTWPRKMSDIPINVGDKVYDPLFPYGFGLGYGP